MDKYSSYHHSGYEWLGELPSHWKTVTIGAAFNSRNEKVCDTEFSALSVTKNGIVPQMENVAKTDAGDNRKRVNVGDFVINSRSDRKGSSGVSDYEGSVSLISIVLEPKLHHPRYIHHLFRSYNFQEEFYRNGKGIVADLWSTHFAEMKNISVPLLDMAEQKVISKYLDVETGRIDSLISEKQNFIDLLKEKRQALISHYVTKGLDPSVEMKDSGVELFGRIPAHWTVTKLERFVEVKDGTHDTPSYVDPSENTFPLITSVNFEGEDINFSSAKHISSDDHQSIDKRSHVDTGDVLMSMIGGNIGKSVLVNTTNSFSIKNVALFKTFKTPDLAYFLLQFLSTWLFKEQLILLNRGGAQGFISLGDIRRLSFLLPPKDELNQIVVNLKERLVTIDVLLRESSRSIDLLRERRIALISAAVTGKIDVRELTTSKEGVV